MGCKPKLTVQINLYRTRTNLERVTCKLFNPLVSANVLSSTGSWDPFHLVEFTEGTNE